VGSVYFVLITTAVGEYERADWRGVSTYLPLFERNWIKLVPNLLCISDLYLFFLLFPQNSSAPHGGTHWWAAGVSNFFK